MVLRQIVYKDLSTGDHDIGYNDPHDNGGNGDNGNNEDGDYAGRMIMVTILMMP